jgi:hypothetical protein
VCCLFFYGFLRSETFLLRRLCLFSVTDFSSHGHLIFSLGFHFSDSWFLVELLRATGVMRLWSSSFRRWLHLIFFVIPLKVWVPACVLAFACSLPFLLGLLGEVASVFSVSQQQRRFCVMVPASCVLTEAVDPRSGQIWEHGPVLDPSLIVDLVTNSAPCSIFMCASRQLAVSPMLCRLSWFLC